MQDQSVGSILEQTVVMSKTAGWIKNDAHRARPFDQPCRKLRVVGFHSTRAHNDSIEQSAQTMGMSDVLHATDPTRFAVGQRDEAIQ